MLIEDKWAAFKAWFAAKDFSLIRLTKVRADWAAFKIFYKTFKAGHNPLVNLFVEMRRAGVAAYTLGHYDALVLICLLLLLLL